MENLAKSQVGSWLLLVVGDGRVVRWRHQLVGKDGQKVEDDAVGPAEAELDLVLAAAADPDGVGGVVLLEHVALVEEVQVAAPDVLVGKAGIRIVVNVGTFWAD